ncbi:MAG: hypothetical protein L3J52_00565 [Proteobacteria bacterium]|nr:hypothetical protein [Pseudomonadota bacterium]
MNLKKDYAEQKKRLLFLYEMTAIIKALHPRKYIHNPFEKEIDQLSELLDIKEALLLKEVMDCITLLNKQSRINEQNQLISTREDFVNALQLVLPKEKRLSQKALKVYETLKETFAEEHFTYYQLYARLKIPKSTFKRHAQVLLVYGLLEHSYTNARSGAKLAQFKVVENTLIDLSVHEQEEEDPYHEMMQEFEDAKGFTDLQFRT